jgi:hypothetical protein
MGRMWDVVTLNLVVRIVTTGLKRVNCASDRLHDIFSKLCTCDRSPLCSPPQKPQLCALCCCHILLPHVCMHRTVSVSNAQVRSYGDHTWHELCNGFVWRRRNNKKLWVSRYSNTTEHHLIFQIASLSEWVSVQNSRLILRNTSS